MLGTYFAPVSFFVIEFSDTDIAPWCELSEPILAQSEWLTPGCKPRHYKPLLQRQTCGKLQLHLHWYII